MNRSCVAGILIGGQGRRMGSATPKHLLTVGDKRLIDPVISACNAVASEVLLVGRGESLDGLERVDDRADSPGPLGGLLGLMDARPGASLLLLACDMPWMTEEALRWLLNQRSEDQMAVMPMGSDDRVEPLGAVYEPEALALLESLDPGSGPSALAGREKIHSPRPPDELLGAWKSVNDQASLHLWVQCSSTVTGA